MTDYLSGKIVQLLTSVSYEQDIKEKFLERLNEENLTRDENPESHFCVYFAAYDPRIREVYLGHHRKSGLWLFNGGHINSGENYTDTLEREIGEEWGMEMKNEDIEKPLFFTITTIDDIPKRICRTHYDIWYFLPVHKNTFRPDNEKMRKEFYKTAWLSMAAAKEVVTDPNTLRALVYIAKNW